MTGPKKTIHSGHESRLYVCRPFWKINAGALDEATRILDRNFAGIYNTRMVTECSLQVRTYECDSYGHVNNANYLNYLEVARYEFLKTVGFDYPAAIKAGYGVYVARVEINYKKSALADDILLIKSWPVKKGAVSGIIAQEIWRGGDLLADAKVTWAFVDSHGMPTKISKEWDVSGLKPE